MSSPCTLFFQRSAFGKRGGSILKIIGKTIKYIFTEFKINRSTRSHKIKNYNQI